jgi:hypothetical protein
MVWTCDENLVEYQRGDSKLDVKMGPVCENVNLIQSLVSDFVSNECLVSVSRLLLLRRLLSCGSLPTFWKNLNSPSLLF